MYSILGENVIQETKRLQDAIHAHCGKNKQPLIYEPDEFVKFCSLHGAANLFKFILSCLTSSRHSAERVSQNQEPAVVILYQLCFGLYKYVIFFKKTTGCFNSSVSVGHKLLKQSY